MTKASNQYVWLDWLRFGAALIVVLAHARHLMFVPYIQLESPGILTTLFYTAGKLGNEAVLIFFVLSGFLVGGKAVERMQAGTFKIFDYTVDRFTRIMIPLIPAIGLTIAIQIYIGGEINWLYVLGNLFAVQGVLVPHLLENEALWTLSYEIWFFIGIGALGLFLINRPLGIILFAICIFVFTKLYPHYLICWLLGMAAFVFRPNKRYYTLIAASIILLIYGIVGRQVGRGTEVIDIELLRAFVPTEEMARIIFAAGAALLIQQLILTRPTGIFKDIEKLGTLLASFSYTLYLSHFPIIRYFQYKHNMTGFDELNTYTIGAYVFVVSLCILVSIIFYWFFEGRTDLVRRKLKSNLIL